MAVAIRGENRILWGTGFTFFRFEGSGRRTSKKELKKGIFQTL